MNSLLLRESFEAKVKHFIFPSCTVMLESKEFQSENDWQQNIEINHHYVVSYQIYYHHNYLFNKIGELHQRVEGRQFIFTKKMVYVSELIVNFGVLSC